MRKNLKEFLEAVTRQRFKGGRVVELGSYQVPGQEGFADLRPFFPGSEYIGCDMRKGPGVDRIEDIHRLSFPNGFANWVICLDTIEHVYDPLKAVKELVRILAPGGTIVISSVMNFQIHDYPGDYWRFTPEIFWHMLSGELPWSRVMFQGDPLNPHTVIGIGCREREVRLNIPEMLDGEPLLPAEQPDRNDAIPDPNASPYRPVIDFRDKNNVHTWIFNRIRTGSSVLELGCADGFFSRLLRDSLGCMVTGMEIDHKAARAAATACEEVIACDLDVPDIIVKKLPDRRFDYIVAIEVLEHLKNPGAIFRQATRLLAPGGRFLFSVPNVAHASLALELLDGRWPTSDSGLLDRTHLHFFTLDSLLEMMHECGFAALSLHRIIINPRNTEFRTLYEQYPREVTAYLEKVNPEFQTYQFAVEAAPGIGGICACDSAARNLLEKNMRLENELQTIRAEYVELKNRLEAIKKGLSWRLTRPLRQLKHTLTGKKGRIE